MRFCLCQRCSRTEVCRCLLGKLFCISWKRFPLNSVLFWGLELLHPPASSMRWKLSWKENQPGGLQSVWAQRFGHTFSFSYRLKKLGLRNLPELGTKYSSLNNSPVAWDYNVANTWTFCKHRRCLVFVMVFSDHLERDDLVLTKCSPPPNPYPSYREIPWCSKGNPATTKVPGPLNRTEWEFFFLITKAVRVLWNSQCILYPCYIRITVFLLTFKSWSFFP